MATVYVRRTRLSKPRRAGRLLAPLLVLLALLPGTSRGAEDSDRPLIGGIRIEGNETFSDGELKSLLRTREPRFLQITGQPRYVRDWLRSDLATLEAFYHRNGFYAVQVTSLREEDIVYDAETGSVVIRIEIEEGKRRYLRALRFDPGLGEEESKIRRKLNLQPGRPFDPQAPGIDQFRILRALQEQGRFDGRVRHAIEVVETPGHAPTDSVDLGFRVERGPPARLAAIALQGNSLSADLIERELTLRRDAPLKLGQILDSKQNLLDSGYFRSVDYRLEAMPADSLDAGWQDLRLTWIFRERKQATVETGVGLGSVDGLRLLGGWSHRNLLDRGQRVALRANLSLKEDGNGDFGLNFERESLEWRFLHISRLRANLGLLLFREKDFELETQAFSLETRAIRLTAARRVDPFTVFKLRQQFDFLDQRSIGELNVADQPTLNTRSISVVLDRDTRDDFFNPRRGGHSWLSYELAGGVQGGDHHFQRLQFNLTRHSGSPRGGILATRLYAGGVWPYGESRTQTLVGVPSDGVPFEERFYCGGSSTVRGYGENTLGPRLDADEEGLSPDLPGQNLPDYILGGRFMLVANVEWRLPFQVFGRRGLSSVLFFDGGGAWESLSDITSDRALPWQPGSRDDTGRVFYGMGAGIRYLTPLTVIRVDFGLPLQQLESRDGRWHFSLGHTF